MNVNNHELQSMIAYLRKLEAPGARVSSDQRGYFLGTATVEGHLRSNDLLRALEELEELRSKAPLTKAEPVNHADSKGNVFPGRPYTFQIDHDQIVMYSSSGEEPYRRDLTPAEREAVRRSVVTFSMGYEATGISPNMPQEPKV